jgi:uncharacterized lipoprotein YmbA
MKPTSLNFLIVGAAMLLASCSSTQQAAQSPSSNAVIDSAASTAPAAKSAAPALKSNKGGQVVESGKYHLELVPEKSANETHLDLYVQKSDDHQAIAGAKVSGEIQFPDGKQKTLTFNYDQQGQHYVAIVSGKDTGAYQLKVTAAIGSDKADGRFSFDR